MKEHRFYLLTLLVLTLFSCSRQTEEKIIYSEYFEGVIESKCHYIKGTDIKEGLCITFNRHGDTLTKSFYSKGKLNGKQIEYYKDGSIADISYYKNDKLNGLTTSYFKNGKPKYEVEYKSGLLWNVNFIYDNKGNKLDPGNFKDGSGILKVYYEDGKLEYKGLMKSGKPTGEWLNYTDTGAKQKVIYNNGYDDYGIEAIFF